MPFKPNDENPVSGAVARAELGKPGPPLTASRLSAIKKQMGISGRRYMYVSAIREWLREHPDFQETQAYPTKLNKSRRSNPTGRQLAA